jgi:hypothetical protein
MREPTEAVAGAALVATRTAWHAVADLVLAGPQYTRSGRIELRATPGGFGTVAAPDLRVDGTDLAGSGGALPLDGSTPGTSPPRPGSPRPGSTRSTRSARRSTPTSC